MLVLLRMNDVRLTYSQQELVSLGVEMANSQIDYDGIVAWINARIKN